MYVSLNLLIIVQRTMTATVYSDNIEPFIRLSLTNMHQASFSKVIMPNRTQWIENMLQEGYIERMFKFTYQHEQNYLSREISHRNNLATLEGLPAPIQKKKWDDFHDDFIKNLSRGMPIQQQQIQRKENHTEQNFVLFCCTFYIILYILKAN